MLVSDFLENSALCFPDKVALICSDDRFSYSEVNRRSDLFSAALLDPGLSKQDRAAVYLENSPEAVFAIFGILKAGGIFCVINPQAKAKKVEYILNDCQARILVTDSRHMDEISGAVKNCPHLRSIFLTDFEASPDRGRTAGDKRLRPIPDTSSQGLVPSPGRRCIDIDLAGLIYTSGSTGFPKGVMLTHLNITSAADSIIEYLGNRPDDVIVDFLPLSFDYGLYQILMAFKFGGTVVLEKSFLYPYPAIELMIREKVTGFPLVPTIAALILRLKNLEKYDFSHLRYITSTGQTLLPKHIAGLQRAFPRTNIFSMYGLTECKRVSYLPPEELKRRPASVGKAMSNTEAFLVNKRGDRITRPGVTGELVVRGANVMKGYWNQPDETERVLKPGPVPDEKVLITGDLFEMDEDGFLYFVGRKDDMIKTAGEKVSPREIENVISEIAGVHEVAAIGIEDEVLGQAVKVFIVADRDTALAAEDILKHCSRNLENYMVPKYIEFRKELPRSAHGKTDTKDLESG